MGWQERQPKRMKGTRAGEGTRGARHDNSHASALYQWTAGGRRKRSKKKDKEMTRCRGWMWTTNPTTRYKDMGSKGTPIMTVQRADLSWRHGEGINLKIAKNCPRAKESGSLNRVYTWVAKLLKKESYKGGVLWKLTRNFGCAQAEFLCTRFLGNVGQCWLDG